MLRSLPPILYITYLIPISSYSKAPWGLSVLSRVTCIFTGIKISPSLWLRQLPDHYAFRAGQNLPDKEFRYLRTVIVTAAVHWGFNSKLPCYRLASMWLLLLTFQHWAGVSPYTSAFALAETCVFGKQLPGTILCGSPKRPPLIPKLRGHFAEFLNHSSLAHLRILSSTTCVGLRYRWLWHIFRSFSWKLSYINLWFPRESSYSRFSIINIADFPTYLPLRLNLNPLTGINSLSPSLHQSHSQYWNFNQLSIDYASRPRLRSWLTQGRRTLPWNPWSFGG